ncbi:MAG: energy transducer TonB [Proteobacteria bacterium]|nr:MAG: energy transducer TonB [Pseudomonadota bacterium]
MNATAIGAGAADRLSFTVFIALIIHAIIIFSLSFVNEDPQPAPHTLEITLAQFNDDKEEPNKKKADFLAQANQRGSGTKEKKSQLSTPQKADFQDTQIHKTSLARPVEITPRSTRKPEKQAVSSTARSLKKAVAHEHKPISKEPVKVRPRRSLVDRALEIASLEARLDKKQRAYAKRPRIDTLTAADTMKTSDAYYMKAWLEKVERIGNLNYPEEARRREIYGRLRLLVALYANGSVKEITVMHSSGHKILDDAAIRIVRLAAPFSPFPEEVRKERDILRIIRTWSFQEKGLSSY